MISVSRRRILANNTCSSYASTFRRLRSVSSSHSSVRIRRTRSVCQYAEADHRTIWAPGRYAGPALGVSGFSLCQLPVARMRAPIPCIERTHAGSYGLPGSLGRRSLRPEHRAKVQTWHRIYLDLAEQLEASGNAREAREHRYLANE